MVKPSIAIIGASADRAKFGNKAVRAFASQGYDVYPVHPRESTIEGFPAYSSIRDIPLKKLDAVSIYLPKEPALKVLEEIAKISTTKVWLNPGADDPAVVAKARELRLPVVVGCSIVAIGVDPHSLT
jgi:predicted CoA-binding protein